MIVSAFATRTLDPISGSSTLTYQTKKPLKWPAPIMSARDQGSQPSTIWTPRDHNLMAKDVDEPRGNRQQRISGVAVAGGGPSPNGHGCGRSHFRHCDRFVAGTRQLLGQRLRLLRQSGRQYALCVISAPTTGGGQ